jgi:hypothetical protein
MQAASPRRFKRRRSIYLDGGDWSSVLVPGGVRKPLPCWDSSPARGGVPPCCRGEIEGLIRTSPKAGGWSERGAEQTPNKPKNGHLLQELLQGGLSAKNEGPP